jgi:hypothetical protein
MSMLKPIATCRALLGVVSLSAFAIPAISAEPAINAQILGLTESVLQYCAKVDPGAAEKLEEKIKRLVGGASDETVAKVRRSEQYRTAYSSATQFVSQVDDKNAPRVCADALAEHP